MVDDSTDTLPALQSDETNTYGQANKWKDRVPFLLRILLFRPWLLDVLGLDSSGLEVLLRSGCRKMKR